MKSVFHGVTYCKYFVNKDTGEMTHIITSDDPIPDAMDINTDTGTLEPNPEYDIITQEIDCDQHIRGRELIENMEHKSGDISLKANASKAAKRKVKHILSKSESAHKRKMWEINRSKP